MRVDSLIMGLYQAVWNNDLCPAPTWLIIARRQMNLVTGKFETTEMTVSLSTDLITAMVLPPSYGTLLLLLPLWSTELLKP